MNVVYLVSVFDRINLFKVCIYIYCDDWFTQWQKEAGQQHGKSLPISSWDAAEEVVASAIYGSGYYISLKFSIMSMCHFPAIYLQCAIPEIDAALLAAKDVRPWAVQRSLLQDLSFPKWFPETHPQTLPPSERLIDWCFCGQSVRRGSSLTPPLPCTEERRFHSRVKRFHGNMAAHQLIYWNKCLKKHFHRTRDACTIAQQIG